MFVAVDENLLMWSNEHGWIADIDSATFFTKEEIETLSKPMSSTGLSVEWVSLFAMNEVQFARLIAEAQAADAFTEEVMVTLSDSMDLEIQEVTEILDRAIVAYDTFVAKVAGTANRKLSVATESQTQYVIVVGNVIDGLEIHGPFSDIESASDYAESDQSIRDDTWVIAELNQSGNKKDNDDGL